jgi:hypothetical protein
MLVFGLAPNGSDADDDGMAYVVTRNRRFCVVAYGGHRPLHRSSNDVAGTLASGADALTVPALKWLA